MSRRATLWISRASRKPEEALSKRSPFGESLAAATGMQRTAKSEKDPVTFSPIAPTRGRKQADAGTVRCFARALAGCRREECGRLEQARRDPYAQSRKGDE